MKLLPRPVTSSLGCKYIMAITGLLLIGFVIVHMTGNLLIYAGPDALNSYAEKLKTSGPLLWIARLGLLTIFVVHLIVAIRLRYLNTLARPVRYEYEQTLQASWASRHMMLTGLVLLAFIVFHLAHFTLGVVKSASVQIKNGQRENLSPPRNYLELADVKVGTSKHYIADPNITLGQAEKDKLDVRQDVYSMVVNGFRNVWVSLTYIVAMIFLGLHLWHGGSSWLQSLGLNAPAYRGLLAVIGPVLAGVVVVGNCSMPIYVMLRFGVVT